MLSHHFPLHRYQGTFQKDLEGQLQEFQGNMLYRALWPVVEEILGFVPIGWW